MKAKIFDVDPRAFPNWWKYYPFYISLLCVRIILWGFYDELVTLSNPAKHETWYILSTKLIFKSLIRQIMIPHQCTDSIMRNWLYSGVLRTISWYQISLLFKLHWFLFLFNCILLKMFKSILQLNCKKYVPEQITWT